jgi:anti-anti-sigma factor
MSASFPPPNVLRCDVSWDDGRAVVVPVGEIDLATVGIVDERLARVRAAGGRSVVLDLGRVTFLDSSGLRMLVVWAKAARREAFGFQIALAPQDGVVRRVLELTGLADRLPIIVREGPGPE